MGATRFVKMYENFEFFCAENILDDVFAVALKFDIEVLWGKIVLDRSARDFAIDRSFPQLKAVRMPVTGRKSNRLYQFIVLEGCDGADYVISARDLALDDPVTSLDDFDPLQLHALRVAAGVAAA